MYLPLEEEEDENEEEKEGKNILRVVFRTFDPIKNYRGTQMKINIFLTKLFTIPWYPFYKGFSYDHVLILTPQKERFSIRIEDGDKKSGVYCIEQDGFYKSDNVKNRKYKLIFAFSLSDDQLSRMQKFIVRHCGEPYSLKNANWNVLINKFFFLPKSLQVDDWNNKQLKKKRWDCVTLAMRLLAELDIIPEFLPNGKKVNLLGLSALDMANLLIKLCKNNELDYYFYVSKELMVNDEDYEQGIDFFYEEGSKQV